MFTFRCNNEILIITLINAFVQSIIATIKVPLVSCDYPLLQILLRKPQKQHLPNRHLNCTETWRTIVRCIWQLSKQNFQSHKGNPITLSLSFSTLVPLQQITVVKQLTKLQYEKKMNSLFITVLFQSRAVKCIVELTLC